MFAIRVYVAALTLTFLLFSVMTGGIGVLQATVIVCPVLYMILDMRADVQDLKLLEARVSSLSR